MTISLGIFAGRKKNASQENPVLQNYTRVVVKMERRRGDYFATTRARIRITIVRPSDCSCVARNVSFNRTYLTIPRTTLWVTRGIYSSAENVNAK